MKKLLIILLIGFTSCCPETNTQSTKTEVIDTTPEVIQPLYNNHNWGYRNHSYDGMTYITLYGSECMNTINYTKDSLEVLLLKKQLNNVR